MSNTSKRSKKDERAEELIGIVLKGQMYKEAGLKSSAYKELEGCVFDHLCSLKKYQTRKYICDYASKMCKKKSEDLTINDEWLDAFVLRFCLVKKAKDCGNEKEILNETSDDHVSDCDQSSPKPKNNVHSMDICVDTENGHDKDSSNADDKQVDTSVCSIVSGDGSNNQSGTSEKTIPFSDSDCAHQNNCDKSNNADEVQSNLDKTISKPDDTKSQSSDEEPPAKCQSTDDDQSKSSISDGVKSPSNSQSSRNDITEHSAKSKSTVSDSAESPNSSVKSHGGPLPADVEVLSSDGEVLSSSDGDAVSPAKSQCTSKTPSKVTQQHKSLKKSRCNKIIWDSDSSMKSVDESNKKSSDNNAKTTKVTESDADVSPTKVTESDADVSPTKVSDSDADVSPTKVSDSDADVSPTKVSDSDADVSPTKVSDSDADVSPTKVSDSDDDAESDKILVSDDESPKRPLIKLKSLASLMPDKEVFTLSSSSDEHETSGSKTDEHESSGSKTDEHNLSRETSPLEEILPGNRMPVSSKAEKEFYANNRAELLIKVTEKVTHCTSCFQQVNRTFYTDVLAHPVLGVLICKKCSSFYGEGDFNKDEDGFDEYCRWCANGGDLLICDHCTNGFCKVCIKRNVGRSALKEAMNSDQWKCYVCDLNPLFELRSMLRIMLENLQSEKEKTDGYTRSKKKEASSVNKFANFTLQREIFKKKASKSGKLEEHSKLYSNIDEMKELLCMCIKQLEKIGNKFQNNVDDDSYVDARRRFVRLNTAMQSNFRKLLTAYLEGSNLTVENVLGDRERKKSVVKKAAITDSSPASPMDEGNANSIDDHAEEKISAKENTSVVKDVVESGSKDTKKKSQIAKKLTAKRKHSKSPRSSDRRKSTRYSNQSRRSKRAKVQSDSESASEAESNDKDDSKKVEGNDDSDDEPLKKNVTGDLLNKTEDVFDDMLTLSKKAKNSDSTQSGQSDDSDGGSQSILKNVSANGAEEESDAEETGQSEDKSRKCEAAPQLEQDKKNESAKRQLFNSDSSDEDEVNISSAVESLLDENLLQEKSKESPNKSRKRERSVEIKQTARKRTKLSLDKEAILAKKNAKAKNALFNSSSDDDSCKSKPSKKTTRRKTAPVSSSDDEKEMDNRVKRCFVSVCRLSRHILDQIDADGFVLQQDVKRQKVSSLFKDNSDDSTSDTEFKKIISGCIKPKKCEKAIQSPGSDASDEGSNSDDNSESNVKNVSKTKKHTKLKSPKKDANMSFSDTDSDEFSDEKSEDELDAPEIRKSQKSSLNDTMKKALLLTSEEESSDSGDGDSPDDPDSPKKLKKKSKKHLLNNQEDKSLNGEKKASKKTFHSALTLTSDDDGSSSESSEKSQSSGDPLDSGSDFAKQKVKKKSTRRRSDSDTSGSSSDDRKAKKGKTRQRIRRCSNSSSGSDDKSGKEKDSAKKETPSKKKVRRIIKDDDLLESTKNAAQVEQSRKKRVKERNEKFKKLMDDESATEEKFGENLVLDFDSEKKIKTVYVDQRLHKHLKPHQEKGIKFMWDATIEAVDMLEKDEGAGGCILAHCMGLGKTLSVIAFLHTLLTNRRTSTQISNVLVCCPVNTIYNWVAEFKNWLKGRLPFDVIELASQKSLAHRAYKLDDWFKEGGIMVIGYDMYRNFTTTNKKRKSRINDVLQKCLVSPGPDLIVCDEGHILKNEKTALAIALNKIETRRRIVLTGTPLQNNLKEYHCMIQFVKPNLLGSRKEFLNRFVNPIEAGQCADADASDVRRMKRRAHILHNMLEGCVQRFDYSVIQPFLPAKYEYVLSIQMTDMQCQFYRHYLEHLAQGGPKRTGSGLFVDFSNLSKIWNHPFVLQLDLRRHGEGNAEDDDEDDMGSFIDDESSSSSENSKTPEPPKEIAPSTDAVDLENGLTDDGKVKRTWWQNVLTADQTANEVLSDPEIGGKLVLLIDILKKCDAAGDKILLFSQSLLTLTMIEHFLGLLDVGAVPYGDDSKPKFGSWKIDRDYMRLDGSTALDTRKQQLKNFNSEKCERCRLFLISTRAGGIGINLVGANRVIIFDSSWNPSHDIQAIFRIYRFGQKKKCYVYRFVAQGTMEEKIYSRQVTKLATSLRVVDEQQIKRNFRLDELVELYKFTPADSDVRETPKLPEDLLLADLLVSHRNVIVDYHEHDSLLENQTSEELTEEERTAAWEDYEHEKKMSLQQRHVMNIGASNITDPLAAVLEFDLELFVKNLENNHPTLGVSFKRDAVRMAADRHRRAEIQNYMNLNKFVFEVKNNIKAGKAVAFTPDMLANLDVKLRLTEANIKRDGKIMETYSNHTVIRTPSQIIPGISGVQNQTYASAQAGFPNRNSFPTIMQPATNKENSSGTIASGSNKKKDDPKDDIVTLE